MSNENGNYTINLYHLVQICVSNFRISTLYYQIHSGHQKNGRSYSLFVSTGVSP